ncbi:Protein-tyrosine phosphatase receptor/non-receptor type [Lasiodiplodia theobromae]|uniref:Protein-tyrosine phosphatase receptor/non-receptor type n=1 Tax=Lasiodiplodia theobromae TaxID=45133 RepID=UPI0015C31D0D|nr:Protein-tyrosine phosphatase receptor/non-receptor type [Lasiodiplodia theobromae]KAF4533858.1 Protein-tyrosine phosphatase receptor/non-receptor type [Lasiodiplodia theobromae]KAF9638150.1 Protein-tyrosine phosphatase receptor/non-receptor type [Lasiodiplodia theobromae]
MTTPPFIADRLWHSLCPAYARLSTGTRRALLRTSTQHPSALRPRKVSLPAQCARHSSTTGTPVRFVAPGSATTKGGEVLALKQKRRYEERLKSTAVHELDGVETAQIYHRLRRLAADGDIDAVEHVISYLLQKRGEEPNVALYDAAILSNVSAEKGSAARATVLLREMGENGLEPTAGTCHDILRVVAAHPDYLLRDAITQYMRQRWFNITDDGRHDIAVGLLRESQLELALSYMDTMVSEGIPIKSWLYDMAIYTLCDVEEVDEALKIMQRRVESGEQNISKPVWYSLLDAASSVQNLAAIEYVWKRQVGPGHINPSSSICFNILAAVSRVGDADLATDVFRVLSERKEVFTQQHYEMLVDTYIQAGDMKTALSVLCIMQTSGAPPNDYSTRKLFQWTRAEADRPVELFDQLRKLKDDGHTIPLAAINVLIEAAIFRDDFDTAVDIYKALHTLCEDGPSTSTFNTLLRGCRHRKDLAMFLAAEMVERKVEPDALTYDRLLLASLLRQIVAGPRARHPEAGLDLCYVTDSIIATSGPSGTYPQRAYRNPLDQLVKFLDKHHGQKWAIWEFRAEGTGYPDEEVYGRIWHYPWPDHHPPPFALVPRIVASMRNWLRADKDNVAVVHCKAGKGRSGTVSCSYLIAEEGWKAEDALKRFTERRMRPSFGPGVSIPSQLRWVGYVDRWTKGGKVYVERQIEILEVHAWGIRNGVRVSIEGFVDEGKVIKTFHTFSRAERQIVRGTVKDSGGLADVVNEVLAQRRLEKAAKEDQSSSGSSTPVDRKANKELPLSPEEQESGADDSPAEYGDVIFRPSKRVVLPTSDINIDFERRNKAMYGYTMVTSVAHVWFNTFFEGNGPEQKGKADDSGTFELEWSKMDGIKGSSRKGTRAFDKVAVVWRAIPDSETGHPDVVITEPKVGEEVPQSKPADWKGGEPSERNGKELGLRTETPPGGSPSLSKASSVRTQNSANNSGMVSTEDTINETMGLKTHGRGGEQIVQATSSSSEESSPIRTEKPQVIPTISNPELASNGIAAKDQAAGASTEPTAGIVQGKEHVSTSSLPGGVPEEEMKTAHPHGLGHMKSKKDSETSS